MKVNELFDAAIQGQTSAPDTSKNAILSRGIKDEISRLEENKPPGPFSAGGANMTRDLALAKEKGNGKVTAGDIQKPRFFNKNTTLHDVVLSCMGDNARKSETLKKAVATQNALHSSHPNVHGELKPATLKDWTNLYNNGYITTRKGALNVEFFTEIRKYDLKDPASRESFALFCQLTGLEEGQLAEPGARESVAEAAATAAPAQAAPQETLNPKERISRMSARVGNLATMKEAKLSSTIPGQKSITVDQWKEILKRGDALTSKKLIDYGNLDKTAWKNLEKALKAEVKELDKLTMEEVKAQKGNETEYQEANKTAQELTDLNLKIRKDLQIMINLSFEMS
jgi:hypothetical protein